MARAKFTTTLIEGHGGVTVALVPFDPEELFAQKPIRLDPRRHGWLVKGEANGVPFDGYIGDRWGKFFIIVDAALRKAAKLDVGDTLEILVEPTSTARALARAREQSQSTTAPKKPRADAIDPDEKPQPRKKR